MVFLWMIYSIIFIYMQGHRERLWNKILCNDHINDLDIIEILLFLIIPRKDTKQLAIELKKNTTSLTHLFSNIDQYTNNNQIIKLFKLMYLLINRVNREKVYNKTIGESFTDLITYLKFLLCEKYNEEFYVVFLDKKKQIKKIEHIFSGSEENIQIYPKQILRKCILYSISNIILVHNHPSHNPNPSNRDIEITNYIVKCAKILDINIVDHIIIGGNNFFSFKHNSLI